MNAANHPPYRAPGAWPPSWGRHPGAEGCGCLDDEDDDDDDDVDDAADADDDDATAAAADDDDDDDLYCEAKACLGQRRTPACNYYSTHNRLKLNHHHHHWHQHQHHHHAADDAEC